MNEEYNIQVAVVNYIRNNFPNILLTISPSGMKLPIGVATKLKRMGYLAGTPDLIILEPSNSFHGLFIELKTKTGVKSDSQKYFIEELSRRGYCAKFCFGYDEAISAINAYLLPTKEIKENPCKR